MQASIYLGQDDGFTMNVPPNTPPILDPKQGLAFHAGYNGVHGTAPRVALGELGPFCVAAIVASLGGEKLGPDLDHATKCGPALSKLSDRVAASRLVVGRAETLLRTAGDYIGTHTGKIPDNRLPYGAISASQEVLGAGRGVILGVASGTFANERPVSGSGNGAQNREMRLMSWSVRVGDADPRAIVELLAGGGSEELDALLSSLEVEAADILRRAGAAYATRAATSAGLPDFVPAGQSTVFWPLGEDRYVAVSPLPSFALMSEMERRMVDRMFRHAEAVPSQRFATSVIGVGGTKPQNTALITSDAGGRLRRLLALPPEQGQRGSKELLGRLARGEIRFSGRDVSKQTLEWLVSAMGDTRDNKEARDRLDAAVEQVVEAVLTPLRRLARAAAANSEASVHPSNRVLAALAGFDGQEATDQEISTLAERATRAALERLEGLRYGGPATRKILQADDRAFERLREKCENAVREYAR